jgi:hypothetical protein
MKKFWLLSAAALVMVTGAALAQSTLSDTTTTTHTASPDATFKSSKTEKSIDKNGVEVEKSQAYTSGAGGTSASSNSRVTAPDGSQVNTSHDERTTSPSGDTTTTSHTTTVEH